MTSTKRSHRPLDAGENTDPAEADASISQLAPVHERSFASVLSIVIVLWLALLVYGTFWAYSWLGG